MFATRSQFYKPKETEQKPDEVVDVSGWSIGDSFTPYPDGTRAKFDVFCSGVAPYGFLIPNHRYLFKKTFERRKGIIFYEQFWVEIIAYKLGRVLDIPVPPAFVGCYQDPNRGLEYASLIEWYYNYPDEAGCLVNRGGDFMSQMIPGYDRKKGRLHNFETITKIFTDLIHVQDWQAKWAVILLFDAIIGNTDRHQENWEIYSYFNENSQLIEELSPAFDNGTSMGYDILLEKISGKLANLQAYINRGTHHMMWSMHDEKHAKHFELLEKLIARFPQTEQAIKTKLRIDISTAFSDILQLTEFEIHDTRYRLTQQRAEFIIKLIDSRYNRLRKMFKL